MYNGIIGAQFTPRSLAEMDSFIGSLTERHMKAYSALSELDSLAGSLDYLKNDPANAELYGRVQGFRDKIESMTNSLASTGTMDPVNMMSFIDAKNMYTKEIKPISDAVNSFKLGQVEMQKALAIDPTSIFQRPNLSVMDYVNDPTTTNFALSGANISKMASDHVLPIAKRMLESLGDSVEIQNLFGDYYTGIKYDTGVNPSDFVRFLSSRGKEGNDFLSAMADEIYKSIDPDGRWDRSRDQIMSNILKGMSSSIGPTNVQILNNPAMAATTTGTGGNGSNDDYSVGVVPVEYQSTPYNPEFVKPLKNAAKSLGFDMDIPAELDAKKSYSTINKSMNDIYNIIMDEGAENSGWTGALTEAFERFTDTMTGKSGRMASNLNIIEGGKFLSKEEVARRGLINMGFMKNGDDVNKIISSNSKAKSAYDNIIGAYNLLDERWEQNFGTKFSEMGSMLELRKAINNESTDSLGRKIMGYDTQYSDQDSRIAFSKYFVQGMSGDGSKLTLKRIKKLSEGSPVPLTSAVVVDKNEIYDEKGNVKVPVKISYYNNDELTGLVATVNGKNYYISYGEIDKLDTPEGLVALNAKLKGLFQDLEREKESGRAQSAYVIELAIKNTMASIKARLNTILNANKETVKLSV